MLSHLMTTGAPASPASPVEAQSIKPFSPAFRLLTSAMSSAQPTEADNRPKKTRTRASKACLVCRQRKVRCNVALTGSPCSNCRLDHETCVVPERSNRR